VLRRDAYHMPAHLWFCFSAPWHTRADISFSVEIAIPNLGGNCIFGPQAAEIVQKDIPKQRKDKEVVLKVENSKIFGRLVRPKLNERGGVKKDQVMNEGGEIPSKDLRKFFEPEYFPELFFSDFKTDLLEPRPFFPTLNFVSNETDPSIKLVSVHSFDFTEFQSSQLKELLICQRQLVLHTEEVAKLKREVSQLDSEISSTQGSLDSLNTNPPPKQLFCCDYEKKSGAEAKLFEFKTFFLKFPGKIEGNIEYSKLQVPCCLSQQPRGGIAADGTTAQQQDLKKAFEASLKSYCDHVDPKSRKSDLSQSAQAACDAKSSRTQVAGTNLRAKTDCLEKVVSIFLELFRPELKQSDKSLKSLKKAFGKYRSEYMEYAKKNPKPTEQWSADWPKLLEIIQHENAVPELNADFFAIHAFYCVITLQDFGDAMFCNTTQFAKVFKSADLQQMLKACDGVFRKEHEGNRSHRSISWELLANPNLLDHAIKEFYDKVVRTFEGEEFTVTVCEPGAESAELIAILEQQSKLVSNRDRLKQKLLQQKSHHLDEPLPPAARSGSSAAAAAAARHPSPVPMLSAQGEHPIILALPQSRQELGKDDKAVQTDTILKAFAPASTTSPPPSAIQAIQALETFKFFLQEDNEIFEKVTYIP
jgi:hypothetical protein